MKIGKLVFICGLAAAGVIHIGHLTGLVQNNFPAIFYTLEMMVAGIGAMLIFSKEKEADGR